MKKHIAPAGAINRYRVTRVSTGYITEVAYVTAKDEEEAHEKLFNDELDSDFEVVNDHMSVEEELITLCKSQEMDFLTQFIVMVSVCVCERDRERERGTEREREREIVRERQRKY